jgi:hypothetical protein
VGLEKVCVTELVEAAQRMVIVIPLCGVRLLPIDLWDAPSVVCDCVVEVEDDVVHF